MALYDEDYISTRDIDWFGVVNGRYIHVASFCGKLPIEVMDKEYLRDLQYEVALMPDLVDESGRPISVGHNDQYLEDRFAQDERRADAIEDYKRSFDSFARKGFWSFDKVDLNNPEDSHYRLISWPLDDRTPQFESEIKFNKNTEDFPLDAPEECGSIDFLSIG